MRREIKKSESEKDPVQERREILQELRRIVGAISEYDYEYGVENTDKLRKCLDRLEKFWDKK